MPIVQNTLTQPKKGLRHPRRKKANRYTTYTGKPEENPPLTTLPPQTQKTPQKVRGAEQQTPPEITTQVVQRGEKKGKQQKQKGQKGKEKMGKTTAER